MINDNLLKVAVVVKRLRYHFDKRYERNFKKHFIN